MKCWVCSEPSSGNHYGALTCEACKLFFRRHSTQPNTVSTTNNNNNNNNNSTSSPESASSNNNEGRNLTQCTLRNCIITSQTRGSCPECRYRKCIAVGMGLNRTTFGRHTTIQKLKYNSRVTDLYFEIARLFEALLLEMDECSTMSTDPEFQDVPLMVPVVPELKHETSVIKSRSILEVTLFTFYWQIIDLLTPTPANGSSNLDLDEFRTFLLNSGIKMPLNILMSFCVIFDFNLKLSAVSDKNEPLINTKQLQIIYKQIQEIDEHFGIFAPRVKIVYFILIVYSTFSANASDPDFLSSVHMRNNKHTPKISNAMLFQNSSFKSTFNSTPGFYFPTSQYNALIYGRTSEFEESIEEVYNLQRAILDLLNSELDFQNNNVSDWRGSLLTKLEYYTELMFV